MRRWPLNFTAARSGEPLTPEQIAASRPAHPAKAVHPVEGRDPRPWLAARIAACRACEHVARGGQSCVACDLRCAHPLAGEHLPLLADQSSTCPANIWPTLQ